MQCALGDDWKKLPPALQAHYAHATDTGHMDIEYPRFMQLWLTLLRCLGALVNRAEANVATVVEKSADGDRQIWHRTMTYADNKIITFNTVWIHAGGNQLIEFVNPVLGLQMAVHVEDGRLHYQGIRIVAKFGRMLLPIPEWLVLGHTTIIEDALSATRFAMDFRLTHPIFGQVFRYSGEFETGLRVQIKPEP
jgi:hypothetical protein